jgi:hypothetical protein
VRACLNANTASGAEFTLEVDNDGLAILDFVDLVLRGGIYGVKLQRVNGARDHTIVTAGTIFHVNVHCKCHIFHAPAMIDFKID